jgi:hypothetical protein
MATDVIEGANAFVATFDEDDRDAGDLDLLGDITADARQLLDPGHIEPRPFEHRFAFQFEKLG